jgi:predicted N-acetyltransferase YhbS
MSDLVYRCDYASAPAARAAFKDYLVAVHGLDLTSWEAAGCWGGDYRQFSYFTPDGTVVSTVSVYSVDLVVDGREVRAAQLSGVGTLSRWRLKGLNRSLTERALAAARSDHEFVYLFADGPALPFYRRGGFTEVDQWRPVAPVGAGEPSRAPFAVDMEETEQRLDLLQRARERAPVSQQLGARSPELFMFHALFAQPGRLAWLPELDAVVLVEHQGPRCVLHDVVAPVMPTFAELLPLIRTQETTEVAFGFVPDLLQVEPVRWERYRGDHLCDRGEMPFRSDRFIFPATSHA